MSIFVPSCFCMLKCYTNFKLTLKLLLNKIIKYTQYFIFWFSLVFCCQSHFSIEKENILSLVEMASCHLEFHQCSCLPAYQKWHVIDRIMMKLPQTSVVFNGEGHISVHGVPLRVSKQNQNWFNKPRTNSYQSWSLTTKHWNAEEMLNEACDFSEFWRKHIIRWKWVEMHELTGFYIVRTKLKISWAI